MTRLQGQGMPDQFSRPCYAYGRPGGSGRILVLYLEYTELASQDSSEIVSLRSSRLDDDGWKWGPEPRVRGGGRGVGTRPSIRRTEQRNGVVSWVSKKTSVHNKTYCTSYHVSYLRTTPAGFFIWARWLPAQQPTTAAHSISSRSIWPPTLPIACRRTYAA